MKLKSALSNNGGFNFRRQRFAGLLTGNTSDQQKIAILHSLIMENGVRKTTLHNRNSTRIVEIVDQFLPHSTKVRIIDVGGSSGVDLASSVDLLSRKYEVTRAVLADRYLHIVYDAHSGVIFDDNLKPLQLSLGKFGFFSFNFAYNFLWQRWLSFPQKLVSRILRRRIAGPGLMSVTVPLVDPSLLDAAGNLGAPFELEQFDVFAVTSAERYEIVICLHLLVPRYFDTESINQGRESLKQLVAENGILLMGDLESPEIWKRNANGVLEGPFHV